MRRIRIIPIGLCLIALGVCGQSHFGGPVVYPEKLKEDVEVIRGLIHQAHPDPYRYCTRTELDRLFDAVRDSIRVPIGTDAFQTRLLPVFQRIGDAGVSIELDRPTHERSMEHVPVLPLNVRVLDGALYVDGELKGFRSVPLGSRILAINGVTSDEILNRLGSFVITDGANETLRWRTIEQRFPWLYLRAFGDTSSFRLEFESSSAVRSEEVVFAMTGQDIERSRKATTDLLYPWHSTWEGETSTLWVTLRTLDDKELEAVGQSAPKFLGEMIRELKRNKGRTLVVDVRGASGRELGMAELIFATIANEPFRVVQGMTVRSGTPPDAYDLAEPQPEHYASVTNNYLPDANGAVSLRADDQRLEPVQPDQNAFKGKVFVVCDGATRDAAAALVMLAKRSGRARIVGEETGTNAYSFTGGRRLLVTTPNAGLRIGIPLLRYLPDGSPTGSMDRGELPHHPAQQQAWGIAKGRDTVRGALLEMIRELQ